MNILENTASSQNTLRVKRKHSVKDTHHKKIQIFKRVDPLHCQFHLHSPVLLFGWWSVLTQLSKKQEGCSCNDIERFHVLNHVVVLHNIKTKVMRDHNDEKLTK